MQLIFIGGFKGKLCLLGGLGGFEVYFFQEIYYVKCEFNKFEFFKEGLEFYFYYYIFGRFEYEFRFIFKEK